MSIDHIAFLTPGNFPAASPREGLETTLRLFETGERLGFDSAWVRSRHLERGVSSAATVLAAATQRTKRIGLGAAVIQLGYENPFRLAEDLATVDVLSGGRLLPGVSAGPPLYGKFLGDLFYDGDPAQADYSHARALRLRESIRSRLLGDEDAIVQSPAGNQRPRLHPLAPGLDQRLWYGGGSLRSAEWAGRNGFHLLIGNLNQGEKTDDFWAAQRSHLDLYRAHWTADYPARVALGRVIVPTDGASAATRQKYAAFAASRHARTLAPQGERRTLFSADLVGSADQILENLRTDPILPLINELRLELPYDFEEQDYVQILEDLAGKIAPELGWRNTALAA